MLTLTCTSCRMEPLPAFDVFGPARITLALPCPYRRCPLGPIPPRTIAHADTKQEERDGRD